VGRNLKGFQGKRNVGVEEQLDRKEGLSSPTTRNMDSCHQIPKAGEKNPKDQFGSNSATLGNEILSSASMFLK